MKRPEPPRPDSEATRRALLPARIAFWRKAGTAPKLVAGLEAELEALIERDAKDETP